MILDANGQPIGDVDTHDEAELLAAMTEELRVFTALGVGMEVVLQPITVIQLAGLVQLALRHPDLPDNLRGTAAGFLEAAREYFTHAPAVRAVLDRGDNPGYDVAP